MPGDDGTEGMIQPEPETVQRIGWVLTALLFALAIVSFIGEVRGWWGFWGELGMLVGTLGGLGVGFSNLFLGADSRQVETVHEAVRKNGETLVSMDSKLGKLDELDVIQAELDAQTGALKHQVRVLEQIRDSV